MGFTILTFPDSTLLLVFLTLSLYDKARNSRSQLLLLHQIIVNKTPYF
ncbi:hypothetical protein H4W00_001828 [Psychrobacter sp. PL19]|jgi:hypothetical protein